MESQGDRIYGVPKGRRAKYMDRIGLGEFTFKIKEVMDKIAKSGEGMIITKYSKPYMVINVYKDSDSRPQNVYKDSPKEANVYKDSKDVATKEERIEIASASVNTYGCGCEREKDVYLCNKHQRY